MGGTRLAALVAIGILVGNGSPALIAVPLTQASHATSGSGAISGTVTDVASGSAIVDAVVSLDVIGDNGRPVTQSRHLTDRRGRFVFIQLPAGRYIVVAQKSGHLDGAYRPRNPGATGLFEAQAPDLNRVTEIDLQDQQWLSTADVSLARMTDVSGRVVNERGAPQVGAYVYALTRVRLGDTTSLAVGPTSLTDDRGRYLLSGLPAGQYTVMVPSVQQSAPADWTAPSDARAVASPLATGQPDRSLDFADGTKLMVGHFPLPPPPANGQTFAYPPAFAGGTDLSSATWVELTSDADVEAPDVVLAPRVGVRVSGRVNSPALAKNRRVLRLLVPGLEDLGLGTEVATTVTALGGGFTFVNVPEGTYTLEIPIRVETLQTGQALAFGDERAGGPMPSPPGLYSGEASLAVGSAVGSVLGGAARQIGVTLSDVGGWLRTSVTIPAAETSLGALALREPASVSGRLTLEDHPTGARCASCQPGQPGWLPLQLDPADWSTTLSGTREGPTAPPGFSFPDILPGRYVLRVAPPGWWVKSVLIDGREYVNAPIEVADGQHLEGVSVTVTNAPSQIVGTVRESDGRAAPGVAVLLFPADPSRWVDAWSSPAFNAVMSSSSGTYRFGAVPGGDYDLVAVPAGMIDRWRSPDFLKRSAPFGSLVHLGWEATATADLRLTPQLKVNRP